MSVVAILEADRKLIAETIKRAEANVIPWETMADAAVPIHDTPHELKLGDRKPSGLERPPSEHIVLGNVTVAYSHEEQPAGIFRHLSASIQHAGRLPAPVAVAMICEEFGFSAPMCKALATGGRDQPPRREPIQGHVWLEEFEPGHYAVNVIELIRKHDVH